MRRMWRCSVAPNGSLNSPMEAMSLRSRNMGHPLRNARSQRKCDLNKHQRFFENYIGTKDQVKRFKMMGEALGRECMYFAQDREEQQRYMQQVLHDRRDLNLPLALTDVPAPEAAADAGHGVLGPTSPSKRAKPLLASQSRPATFQLLWRAQNKRDDHHISIHGG